MSARVYVCVRDVGHRALIGTAAAAPATTICSSCVHHLFLWGAAGNNPLGPCKSHKKVAGRRRKKSEICVRKKETRKEQEEKVDRRCKLKRTGVVVQNSLSLSHAQCHNHRRRRRRRYPPSPTSPRLLAHT